MQGDGEVLFLGGVGEVAVTVGHDGLSFQPLHPMHRFVVYVITESRKRPSPWVPCEYLFGQKDPNNCKTWVEHLSACINNEHDRPKNLLVFVHPLCGKGRGHKNWETVAPLFDRAKVKNCLPMEAQNSHKS